MKTSPTAVTAAWKLTCAVFSLRKRWCLQDGRRLAPVGFAGDTVDLNTIPLGLIDHVDILKDGASAIYGADAVAGVFNVWLIHRFRGLEIYASYGNTNLGFANDMGEERGYLLAGTGDDKTDIVVYAEFYNRAAIYSRDADISSNADFTRFGGQEPVAVHFAGRVGPVFAWSARQLCLPARFEWWRANTHAARIPKCSERPAICAAF